MTNKKETDNSVLVTWTERSLGTHLGQKLMSDPAVAINELVANAWDAYATKVEIILPKSTGQPFSISDNGSSMTLKEFEDRWGAMDYERTKNQGCFAEKPPHCKELPDRIAYGRNGQGRFGAFCFTGENYMVETKKDGLKSVFKVSKSYNGAAPIAIRKQQTEQQTDRTSTGTRIYGETGRDLGISASLLRAEIGLRYLHDPNFEVTVDGERVTFEHVRDHISKQTIEIDGIGTAELIALDAKKAEKNSLRHGISWQVNNRLVGKPDAKFIDGRTTAAKRFNFIVQADCLTEFVKADWSGFKKCDEFGLAKDAVEKAVEVFLKEHSAEARSEMTKTIRQKNLAQLRSMSTFEKSVWEEFVEKVQLECPTLKQEHLETIASILAKLESSKSKYAVLTKMKDCSADDFDSLNTIFEDWSINTAKRVLDEIRWRIELIKELEKKMLDMQTNELHDLQPIFEKGLWMFGPEFEAPDFTSNRRMSTVIQTFFGDTATLGGSKNRPDFVVFQGSAILLKACPRYDTEVVGTEHVVIVELKAPRVELTANEMFQCQKYIQELLDTSAIQDSTRVSCFLIGGHGKPSVFKPQWIGEHRLISIIPMTFETVLTRAQKRMLRLYDQIADAPFFHDEIGKKYMQDESIAGTVFGLDLDMRPSTTVSAEIGENN